jgi:hypothetical protein
MRRSVVPGADSVCRYRERRAVPLGLWAGLPRGVTALLRSRLVFAFLAGSVALGAATLVTEARRHESWRVTSALVALDTAVASAAADPLAAASRIIEADRALAAVPMEDLASGEWVERGAALEAARDQAWSIERLDGPTRVGLLPAPLRGTDASLVVLADRVYLASVGFYEIDLGTGRLVELLAPGQPVAGGEVGSIVDGVSDGLGVALSDGRSIYRQGSDGRWGALPLNSDGSGERPAPGRSAGFNGHLYALTGDGRVVRYEERGTELAPAQWAGPEEYPDLASARDIVVNGRVHLMLADGRVLAMNPGRAGSGEHRAGNAAVLRRRVPRRRARLTGGLPRRARVPGRGGGRAGGPLRCRRGDPAVRRSGAVARRPACRGGGHCARSGAGGGRCGGIQHAGLPQWR